MNNFSARAIQIYDLPLPAGVDLLHPERVALRYSKSHTIDIGALCYLRRSDTVRGLRRVQSNGRAVDLASFSTERAGQVRKLIGLLSEIFSSGHRTPLSNDSAHRHFVRFLDWCDANKHSGVLNDEAQARQAFRDYVAHLRQLVTQNQLNNNTAVPYQTHCREVLEAFLDIEYLDRGINRLYKSPAFETPTSVPSEDDQGKVMSWFQCIFAGLTELLIEGKPYPYALAVPEYLQWPNNQLWIFPCQQWCRSPAATHQRRKGPVDHIAYDYQNGRIFTTDEILKVHGNLCTRRQLTIRRSEARRKIDAANKNPRCRARIERGHLAMRAFVLLFIANTGMNAEQVINFPWSSQLDDALANPLIERQGFRTVKYRANHKTVSFEIGVKFMPVFRRFLQLRQFLLNGGQAEWLFFGLHRSDLITPVALPLTVVKGTYKALSLLNPAQPRVLPREWRAAKQDNLIRYHDPYVAAKAMQHSLKTALTKYSNGSESIHQQEISDFLSHVERVVIADGERFEQEEARSIGTCTAPMRPAPINREIATQPDCKSAEGCLFCDNFRVHADDRDTRKLVSCRYCINKVSHLAVSQEQFDRVFGIILDRIRFILDAIRLRDCELVARIEHEVDHEGELDPYWACKLETLMELDLV